MSAQETMLDRYQAMMLVNAEAHILRTAREVGLFAVLQEGQATLDQLVERLALQRELTDVLLGALVSMKVLEKYREDYALAGVTRLLCQYDNDLGDRHWSRLVGQLRGAPRGEQDEYYDSAAATQWSHTAAAKQATEILDIGGERLGRRIVDIGCGSAVWSAAMAYADRQAQVTAVDTGPRLQAAKRTVESIELLDRYCWIEGNPAEVSLPRNQFDLAVAAGFLSGQPATEDRQRFATWRDSLKEGGELVLIDLFRGPAPLGQSEAVEALRIAGCTPSGGIRQAEQVRDDLLESGFARCQFVFLAASRQGWGMLVAQKNGSN